ncbi:MAG: hypothetical protein ACQETI_03135 [Halobacteriota archaeon]
MSDVDEEFRHVAPAFHEVDMFLWFRDNGLSPYWAVSNLCINHFDGYAEIDYEVGDEPWHAYISYNKETGIAPRDADPVDGRMYEFKLHAEGPGEQKADFNFSPRWDDQRKPNGDLMKRPWCGGEGLDVHTQGSNLTFDEYIYILQRTLQAFADEAGTDFNRRYFGRPLPQSNIVTVELYVRLVRQMAMKLVRSSGAFFKIMHLLADQEGTEWTYTVDNTEIIGKRHAFDLNPRDVRELVSDHRYGKRMKCYHPKHVRRRETDDDPLSSPKFGVAFHRSLNKTPNGTRAVKWGERDDLVHELEETLVNVLRWAGVSIAPDPTTFVEDDHFDVRPSDRRIGRFPDPTPGLETEQDLVIRRVLNDLRPSADAVLRALATDGGSRTDELAEETDYSLSQVYRALNEVSDLVVNDNGFVRYYSENIRQEIEGIATEVGDHVMSATTRLARLCRVETRSAADSALSRWMTRYGVDFDLDELGGRNRLRIDTVLSVYKSSSRPTLEDVLRTGLDAWTSTGRKADEFLDLLYDAKAVQGGDDVGSVRVAVR